MLRPLNDFLKGALNRTGAASSVKATVIVETAGPLLLSMMPELRPADISVVSYRAGRLTIAVGSPTVGQELRLREETILEVLRDSFPRTTFLKLRLTPFIDEPKEF